MEIKKIYIHRYRDGKTLKQHNGIIKRDTKIQLLQSIIRNSVTMDVNISCGFSICAFCAAQFLYYYENVRTQKFDFQTVFEKFCDFFSVIISQSLSEKKNDATIAFLHNLTTLIRYYNYFLFFRRCLTLYRNFTFGQKRPTGGTDYGLFICFIFLTFVCCASALCMTFRARFRIYKHSECFHVNAVNNIYRYVGSWFRAFRKVECEKFRVY